MAMMKTYTRSSVGSPKKARLIFLTALVMVFVILYYTAPARRVQSQKFYKSTVGAMDAKAGDSKGPASDEDTLFQKLKPNYGSMPGRPPPEVPDKPKFEVPSKDDGKVALDAGDGREERSVAGRKTMKLPKGKETGEEVGGMKEDPEVKQEMNDILKRSPIIIFSKSYCPFSMKAKSILLDKYNIVPSPFVVELDEHPLGRKLQNLLAQNTDRRTVPNILISGLSVGGGDEIAELHEEGKLIEKIRSLGDKRIVEVRLKGQEG